MTRRPVILVSAGFPAYGDYMGITYAEPLEAIGAVPLHMPYLGDVRAALDVADGVVLGFGSDIAPARYGGAGHEKLTPVSERRDAFELGLAEAAIEAGLPVLGICRGMQLLNVARGGSLLPDVAPHPGGDWDAWARVREAVLAGSAGPAHPMHGLRVAHGSRLEVALGGPDPDLRVNSWHHQALDRLGAGVRAVAWADDGIVEAIELEGDAWSLGVQWELQEAWKQDERFLGVFAALVSATARRGARSAAA
jgi:putative glutamine amidotransferase